MNDHLHATGEQETSGSPVASDLLVVLCTFPDIDTARAVSREIISERHAVCANIIPAIESIYRWDDRIQQESEVLVIFKTSAAGFSDLENALAEKHPYDTPEIVALTAAQVSESYLKWVLAES